jgi:hypothetical protein
LVRLESYVPGIAMSARAAIEREITDGLSRSLVWTVLGAAVRNGAAAAPVPSQRDLRAFARPQVEVDAKEVPADP